MYRLALYVWFATYLAAQTEFTSGLQVPQRLIFTPPGNILVTEGGTLEPNTGRISLVDRTGTRRTIVEGLPSGLAHFVTPFGPTGLALDGRTLYVLIGEGDVMRGAPPNYGFNLDGPSSPIFSTVLKFVFAVSPDEIRGPLRLTFGDHWGLFDGYEISLRNEAGDRATVEVLTAFRPIMRNFLGGAERLRPSDPYGVFLDARNSALYIADASSETLVRVDTRTGKSQVVYRFEPFRRNTPAGPVALDNVPTAVCWTGDRFLVSFLSAGPFPEGEASIRSLDTAAGTVTPFSVGFTALTDMQCGRSSSGSLRLFTTELTMNLLAPAPSGRVQVVEGTEKRVLATDLPFPSGLAQDPTSGDLFVVALSGQMFRVPVQ